jgi:class 3 adenylate cyclase/tetratricopeptide (TPR) repeat protein
MSCGASLSAAAPQERRTVSILFADLVGFTERSDTADPEDVRRTLVPFHERAKKAIERFGGTLDKFIGDAAMGVFGAPLAHEDDPERAVRAALELLEASTEEHPIRVAVNTGEAVVTMGAGPQVGEAVAGDVVNTASRLQSAAPPGGLVIGELTWTAVRDRFETRTLPPFTAKGKAEPIAVWQVVGLREDAPVMPVAPLVGRGPELALLGEVVDRARQLSRPQLVTVVSEPGIGKSRVLQELRARVDDDVTWLAGACAPYGEANALAPLAEVVLDLAGVAGERDAAVVEGALEALVGRLEPATSERTWLCTRLAALADASSDPATAQLALAEVAAASARVLSLAANAAPVVVAIEDLHWSEPVLRRVLNAIVDDADCAVVVLTTARPELFDLDAGWGGGRANSVTIELAALTEAESMELVDSLLEATVRGAHPEVLANVGGNPLFAVEFVRMLILEGPADEIPLSVQAVIGARLDSVGPERRAMVQDAAVIGSRFWPEALAAVGELEPVAVRASLNDLVRRGLLVRSQMSSIDGLAEYNFEHGLIREVAYARLPRIARARKHAAVGVWLDGVVGDQIDRFAEPLANHFEQAVLLAREAGEHEEAERWCERAGDALFTAGTVALRLDPSSALDRFERALAVIPPDDPRYAETLAHSALAGRRSGRLDHEEVLRRHQRTVEFHRARGDSVAEARAHASVAGQLMALARPEEARAHLSTAEQLLREVPEDPEELAHVRAWLAEEQMFAGNPGPAREFADQALSTGAASDQTTIMALHIRGDSRIALGDSEGIEDLVEALARAEAIGAVSEIVTSHSYLADREWQVEGPAVALARLDAGSALADRRGAYSQGTWTKVAALELLYELGRWDELLERAAPLAADGRMDVSLMVAIDLWSSAVRLRRGQDVGDLAAELEGARAVEELQALAPALALAALAAHRLGDADRAAELTKEYETATRGKAAMYRSEWAPPMARLAVTLGRDDVAEDLVHFADRATPRDVLLMDTADAIVAADGVAPGVWAALEERWAAYGCPYEQAMAALASGDPEAALRGRALLEGLRVPV